MTWQSYYDNLNPYEPPYHYPKDDDEVTECHIPEDVECQELIERFQEKEIQRISKAYMLVKGLR